MFGTGELTTPGAVMSTIAVQLRRTKVLAFRDNLHHGIEHVDVCQGASNVYYTDAHCKDSAIHPLVIGPRSTEEMAYAELPKDFTGTITIVGFGRLGSVVFHSTEFRENGLVNRTRQRAEPTGEVSAVHAETARTQLSELLERVVRSPVQGMRHVNLTEAESVLLSMLDAGLTPEDIISTLESARQTRLNQEMQLTGHPPTTTPEPTTTMPPTGDAGYGTPPTTEPPQPRAGMTDEGGINPP